MSDTTDYEIILAFVQAVKDCAELDLPVSYPGVTFEPPRERGQMWLELKIFPGKTENYGLADDACVIHRGFFQVSVVSRPGAGVLGGVAEAGKVITLFAKGTAVGPANVRRKPWISAAIDDSKEGRILVPVTIPYQATVSQ